MKDIIVGCASNYTYDQIKYWLNSIRQSGFDGDVAIVGTNLSKETIDKLTEKGVMLNLYGTKNADGSVSANQNGAPHVERFFYIYNFLDSLPPMDYRYVITTDVRDVVFQSDPSVWLTENAESSLIAASEGMMYKDEPWGNENLLQTFGPFFHNILQNATIRNVGVIAGDFDYVRGLMLMIFQMSINRPIPIVDQAVYNFLISSMPFSMDTQTCDNGDAWAIQLGTTREAVRAGNGDLGMTYKNNIDAYNELYFDEQPQFTSEGKVVNQGNKEFVIVHQWDRIPFLKTLIEKKYGEA